MRPVVRILSFDIGKKNFAWYIEDADVYGLSKLNEEYSNLPGKLKRRALGPMNPKVLGILNKLYSWSNRVDMGVVDLRSSNEDKWDVQGRKNLFKFLSSKYPIFSTCDVIVIEQQYFNTFTQRKRGIKKSPGNGANVDAIKIAEDLLAWCMLRMSHIEVEVFSAMYKTHMLGASDSLSKAQRKKWTDDKARDVFRLRGDDDALDQLFNTKKGKQKTDDICDTVMQCQAFKYKMYVADF